MATENFDEFDELQVIRQKFTRQCSHVTQKMALLKFFKLIKSEKELAKEQVKSDLKEILPDPTGSLSVTVPTSSIVAANKEVRKVYEQTSTSERGPYVKLTASQRLEIAKRAAEMGTTSTIRYYKCKYPDLKLTEPTVRRLKNSYTFELKKRPLEERSSLEELPTKKRGKPLMIGEELDREVKNYLSEIRSRGGVVNVAIALGVGKGIVKNSSSHYKDVVPTKDWAKYLMTRMGLVKRRASTAAKTSIENFEEVRKLFIHEVKTVVDLEEIPPDLIMNYDQTGIKYIPTSSWTLEKEGSKRVEIVGKDDKRQITAVLGCSMSGSILPFQLIYEGKTPRCFPNVEFPKDWDITCNPTHWSNETTMLSYLEKIVFPYVSQKRVTLGLPMDYPALLLFDNFNGQCTENLLKRIDSHHIYVILIPANCTDRLQPLDLSVNKSVKDYLRVAFQEWYAESVCSQLQKGQVELIDLRMSVIKPLGAKWMVNLYDYLKSKPEIICNGFRAAGIII